jgi:hypothetical protein
MKSVDHGVVSSPKNVIVKTHSNTNRGANSRFRRDVGENQSRVAVFAITVYSIWQCSVYQYTVQYNTIESVRVL